MVVCYCFGNSKRKIDYNTLSYIWDLGKTRPLTNHKNCNLKVLLVYNEIKIIHISLQIESPNKPCMTLNSSYPTIVCEFNPRDPSILCGGLMNGQVCYWDLRNSSEPVQLSYPRNSHRYYRVREDSHSIEKLLISLMTYTKFLEYKIRTEGFLLKIPNDLCEVDLYEDQYRIFLKFLGRSSSMVGYTKSTSTNRTFNLRS